MRGKSDCTSTALPGDSDLCSACLELESDNDPVAVSPAFRVSVEYLLGAFNCRPFAAAVLGKIINNVISVKPSTEMIHSPLQCCTSKRTTVKRILTGTDFPAPGVRLPNPLENEEELLHSPLKLGLKFLLEFPIKQREKQCNGKDMVCKIMGKILHRSQHFKCHRKGCLCVEQNTERVNSNGARASQTQGEAREAKLQ
ncbi:hypothetical protein EK904_015167 [Melospiza melodia maxima]|nr:hypothetical protein EK904_015167 [Melospiza melodia maxima]